MKPVWIIDDDRSIRWVFEKALARENIAFRTFASAQDALAALETETPQVVVSDIRMPGESGLELLARARALHANLPVIIMTAYSDLESAVGAFQGGAYEYLPKPFDVDHAVGLIRRAMGESARQEGTAKEAETGPEILGQAPAMQDVFRAIGRLSQSHATVLITGESGTGKELVARALHRHSPRAARPFIAINTAAIPRELLESELFGHERGAFTDARTAKPGLFEVADGGTLFLDEVHHLALELQAKLLRALDQKTVRRLGATGSRRVDVRIIAATNTDLGTEARAGRFREDLFYRLNVVSLTLPPLRARGDDVVRLAEFFLRKFSQQYGLPEPPLTADMRRALQSYALPGNVRELSNVIERALLLSPPGQLAVDEAAIASPQVPVMQGGALPFPATMAEIQRAAAQAMLETVAGNRSEAARRLDISRSRLQRLLAITAADRVR